jgi:molybdopterin/thiamine biosynthesis adenylyltransferase
MEGKTTMSAGENDRYASLRLIDWFSLERVQTARVMVVGAGAIGNEVLKNLALLGVGNILIVDPDRIESSNLSRSILYRESDVGELKVEVAKRALRVINPAISVQSFAGKIEEVFGLGVWRRVDVVIGCLDNREARFYVNRAAREMGTPWINAGIGPLNGQVQVFQPGNAACYECHFTESAYEEIRLSCGIRDRQLEAEQKVPTTPTLASLVAAIQVQEMLKLLDEDSWIGRSLAGREFKYLGTVSDAETISMPRRDDCPAHEQIEEGGLIELPSASSVTTSAAEILDEARRQFGTGAVIELRHELAVERVCRKCGTTARLLKRRQNLVVGDLICGTCGLRGEIVTTHQLGLPTEDYFEDFLDLPLANLGIPPLEILRVLCPDGNEAYLELTGDLHQFASDGIVLND